MPYIAGTAPNFASVIDKAVKWATDSAIHGADAWEVVRQEPWPKGTILKAHGLQSGEHFYVGLMTQKFVKGKTYIDWFKQPENVMKFIVDPLMRKKGFVQTGNSVSAYNDAFDATEKRLSASFDGVDIFSRDSQALFFGVFKQYCDSFDWNEQPGALDLKFNPLQCGITIGGSPAPFTPPLYPGVGFPAIGWDFADPSEDYPFKFWITKDRSRMTIVINNGEYWDAAHVGLLIPHTAAMEYALPAVIAGGTSGALVKGTVNYDSGDSMGTLFDYSTKNYSLNRGLCSFSSTPEDSANMISQLAVMLPDGRWTYVANWQQGVIAVGTGINSRAYAYSKPQRVKNSPYSIHPTNLDLRNVMAAIPNENKVINYQLEPLEVVQGSENSKNMLGRIKGVFWPSPPVYKYGEIKIDGKKHLIIPSGRENRRWYNPSHTDMIVDYEMLENIEKDLAQMSKQTICVIRLED